MYKIFKANINDIPQKHGRQCKYPFGQMRINDAFTVPANHAGAQINKSKGCGAASAAYGYARRHGTDKWQFRYNRNDDGSVTIYCTNSPVSATAS